MVASIDCDTKLAAPPCYVACRMALKQMIQQNTSVWVPAIVCGSNTRKPELPAPAAACFGWGSATLTMQEPYVQVNIKYLSSTYIQYVWYI